MRQQLELQMVDYARRLHARGYVANHDGNLTARLRDGVLATPTAVSKAEVSRKNLLVVDAEGRTKSGRGKPFSEIELHLYVYRHRPDVQAVIHAHPPTACGFAVAGVKILTIMMAEPIVSLGSEIPLIPYARPKTPESTLNLKPYLQSADVFLLANHGVLSLGPDLETAYLRLELVEHLAQIQAAALRVGQVRTLPEADIQKLMEAHAKAFPRVP